MSDYLWQKDFDDGRTIWVIPLTFGRARIIIGETGSDFITDGW